MKKMFSHKNAVEDVTYHEVIPTGVNTDAKSHTRLGWWIVIAGVGGFFLWAAFAPLDEGVPVSGTVMVSTNRKAVQPPAGGVVDKILVKEGDVVKAGQPLVKMNNVLANAQADISKVQYLSALATEARLIAERDGKRSVTFPAALTSQKHNPQIADNMRLQEQLFESRRANIQGELAILKEQLDNMRDLAKDGYVARDRVLDMERTYIQRKQGYESEVRTQLVDVQKEAEALKLRQVSLDYDLSNAIVRAPVDGTIDSMNIFTDGGVIGPGFRMMDVVPSADQLIIEGRIPVDLIDKLHTGLSVDLIFSAFHDKRTPHIPGEITMISADRQTDERSGAPYYKMKAVVTPAGMQLIHASNLKIRPGMPVNLFIKTGERTMMDYLMKPLQDRMKSSMSEE